MEYYDINKIMEALNYQKSESNHSSGVSQTSKGRKLEELACNILGKIPGIFMKK